VSESLPPLGRVPYHVGFAAPDLERAMTQLTDLLGVTWGEINHALDIDFVGPDGPVQVSARVVHSMGPPIRVEVIEGSAGSVWATDGVVALHHFAYWSRAVHDDVRALQAAGWTLELAAVDTQGDPSYFAYMTKEGHPRVELVSVERHAFHSELVGATVPIEL
jgi:hypothetical protein